VKTFNSSRLPWEEATASKGAAAWEPWLTVSELLIYLIDLNK